MCCPIILQIDLLQKCVVYIKFSIDSFFPFYLKFLIEYVLECHNVKLFRFLICWFFRPHLLFRLKT